MWQGENRGKVLDWRTMSELSSCVITVFVVPVPIVFKKDFLKELNVISAYNQTIASRDPANMVQILPYTIRITFIDANFLF